MTAKCKVCRTPFAPRLPLQTVCSLDCAKSLAVSIRGKLEKQKAIRDRKSDKAKRDGLKSRADWAREAQAAFNGFIRLRDHAQPCISCGRRHDGQYHAGHYRSVGAAPELRFDELNVHKQCAPCNTHLSGNAVKYRAGLIRRLGCAVVDYLEGPHTLIGYTVDDLRAIKAEYTAKARELRKTME